MHTVSVKIRAHAEAYSKSYAVLSHKIGVIFLRASVFHNKSKPKMFSSFLVFCDESEWWEKIGAFFILTNPIDNRKSYRTQQNIADAHGRRAGRHEDRPDQVLVLQRKSRVTVGIEYGRPYRAINLWHRAPVFGYVSVTSQWEWGKWLSICDRILRYAQ